MGYMRLHAIVVSGIDFESASYKREYLKQAHEKAREIFGEQVSALTPVATNGFQSFLIPPDGSKEGWDESDDGDKRRALFKTFLRETHNASGLDWVEVQFGDDNAVTRIIEDSDHEAEEFTPA
jgi:hypothetical protein